MNKQQSPTLGKKILCAVIATAFACQTWAANVTASVNTNRIGVNEQFQLTLSSDEMSSGSPDLSALQKDFQVLGTSQSSQIQITNGVTSKSTKWIITLSPKQVGTLNIPALAVGTAKSQPINIDVVKGDTVTPTHQGQIAITATIDNATHYQFQEIPLKVRIETSAPIQQAELISPTSPDFEISQTGSDSSSQMVKNGMPVNVIERTYLVRPQKAGTLTIEPFILQGYLQGKRRDPFDDFRSQFGGFDEFFNSPFDMMRSRGQPFAAKSKPITLSVTAASNTQAGEWFLPAKSVELQAQWQTPTPTFKVGEAVTRKIALIALGATPEQLPKLTFPDIDGVKFYVDSDQTASRDTAQGTQALREISVSIVPTQAGEITLPKMQVEWLNTQTNKQETAVLPAEKITVQGIPKTVPNASVQSPTPAPIQNKPETDNKPQTTELNTPSTDDDNINTSLIAGLIIIGGLCAAIAIWIRKKRKHASQDTHTPNDNNVVTTKSDNLYMKNIEDALRAKNVKQLYQALLHWQRRGVTFTDELQQHFECLEEQLYQPESQSNIDWEGIQKAIKQQPSQSEKHGKDGATLPPLY